MSKWLIAVVLVVQVSIGLLLLACGNTYAGDEVDYSAPYLTLENGELITKYPAKEHSTDGAGMPTAPGDIAEPAKQGTNLSLLLGLALAGIVVTGVVLRFRGSRPKRQAEKADQVA